MNFSKRSRYGLRALVDLAVNSGDGCIQLNDIAGRNQISFKYLEQIFTSLRKAGIVRSIKGPQGGYLLGDEPEKIRIPEVIKVLDGSYLLAEENIIPGNGGAASAAAVQSVVIDPVNRLLENFLSSLTLKSLIDGFEEYNGYHQDMYYI